MADKRLDWGQHLGQEKLRLPCLPGGEDAAAVAIEQELEREGIPEDVRKDQIELVANELASGYLVQTSGCQKDREQKVDGVISVGLQESDQSASRRPRIVSPSQSSRRDVLNKQ